MKDVMERAKAALEGVTEGPWEFDAETEYLVTPDGENVPSYIPANTEFIVEARTLVPELVAEVEKLRLALTSDPTLWRESLTARQDIREEFYTVVRDECAEIKAEVERLRARETQLRELAERFAVAKTWDDRDAIAEQAWGRELLAVLDAEVTS